VCAYLCIDIVPGTVTDTDTGTGIGTGTATDTDKKNVSFFRDAKKIDPHPSALLLNTHPNSPE